MIDTISEEAVTSTVSSSGIASHTTSGPVIEQERIGIFQVLQEYPAKSLVSSNKMYASLFSFQIYDGAMTGIVTPATSDSGKSNEKLPSST